MYDQIAIDIFLRSRRLIVIKVLRYREAVGKELKRANPEWALLICAPKVGKELRADHRR